MDTNRAVEEKSRLRSKKLYKVTLVLLKIIPMLLAFCYVLNTPKQTINSLTHEVRHLVDDIAKTEKLDPYGEDVAYLTGETIM